MENSTAKQVLFYAMSLFLAAGTIYLVVNFRQPWFKNIRAEITNQPYSRTINVSAEGKVTAKPDIALVSLSVVVQGTTVKAVIKEGNEKMNRVIQAVKKLGVEDKDVASTQYDLQPNYSYLERQAPKIIGYQLSQQISVKVRKLEQVEDILDSGIAAGANQVGQLTFDIDDASDIKKQARQKAFTAAREKAEEMAAAAGVKLGRVVTFSEDAGYTPPIYANYKMNVMAEGATAAMPSAAIEPGSKELSINVSVTYEIE